ncbi:hypothetical protein [Streptomyces sp. NPDC004629]|uniref:hypothetical protein n=1 Tax=Streptomyces sp. NPDC004629 TaxID=3364705 RepID=UPI00368FA050
MLSITVTISSEGLSAKVAATQLKLDAAGNRMQLMEIGKGLFLMTVGHDAGSCEGQPQPPLKP